MKKDLNIQFLDLTSQYLKIKPEIDDAINRVILSSNFIRGKEVEDFENQLSEYLNVKYVITCGNGTDALQIALMAFDFQLGDEIITPSFNFVSSAEVISLLKLKPVFVDVEEGTFNIDVEDLKRKITPRTKAVIPVHLFGQCANMEEIIAITSTQNIKVIEDAAQALGAEYIFSNGIRKHAGTIADIGTTSFFPSKNLGCFGDGGAIFTNNDELAERIRKITTHGSLKKYNYELVGLNSRLDTIQAAVLNVKLKYLKLYQNNRQNCASFYDKYIFNKDFILPIKTNYSTHVFNQYTLKLKTTKNMPFIDYLRTYYIPAMIYYPIAMHLQNAYFDLGNKNGDFPVSEKLADSVVSIPIHSELSEQQQKYIVDVINNFRT